MYKENKCSLNRVQTRVLLVPGPSLVNAESSVRKGSQFKTSKTYKTGQRKREIDKQFFSVNFRDLERHESRPVFTH